MMYDFFLFDYKIKTLIQYVAIFVCGHGDLCIPETISQKTQIVYAQLKNHPYPFLFILLLFKLAVFNDISQATSLLKRLCSSKIEEMRAIFVRIFLSSHPLCRLA